DAEVELGTSRMATGLDLCGGTEVGARVAREVAGAHDKARDLPARGCQALVDGLACGQLRARLEAGQALGPARKAAPAEAGLEALPVADRDRLALLPGLALGPAASCPLPVEGGHLLGDVEILLGQAQQGLGEAYLLGAERLSMRLFGVGAVGRGPADVAAQHQQRRTVRFGHGAAQPRLEGVEVVGHLPEGLDVPAVGLEAFNDV